MPKNLSKIRIFISSPGDVAEERALTRKVIERLQGEFSSQVKLEAIYWEHEPLRATQTFQEQIIRPSETDIVITILWSRLGTRLPAQFTRPDGSRYESGTEYEFEDAFASFKESGTPDLLIYLKTADPKVSLKDKDALLERLKQKEALDNFFDRWFLDKKDGSLIAAFHPFSNSAEYEEIIESHLNKLFNTRLPEITKGGKLPAIKPAWSEGSPFRGLSVFDFEHSPVFFGRTKAVSEIIDALRVQASSEKAFILILGMSGGGKSSLVRAGVLPMLTQPGVIEGVGLWRRAIMKPGDSPGDLFDGLAACLIQENALPELSADKTDYKELAHILRETPKAAVPLIKGGLSQAASEVARNENLTEQPVARLVLVIDQLEEMFSLKIISHEKRKKFIEALDALSRSGRVWVIATLRSDFYPRTAELEGLVALKEGTGQYDLISPTLAEIGQMIRQPAQAAGLQFEEDPGTNERLDDILRDAAAKNPGALPLLEFTLEELYKQRTDDGMLTFEAYKKLGGVEGALAQRAEEVFTGLEPKVQQTMAVELHFLISIGVDEGERISRKYAPLKIVTATPETKAFVEAFINARLFTTDLAADGKAIVNIAHEALLQHWPRLNEWVEKNKEELRIHSRINIAANRWKNENRSREFLYTAGKQISEAELLLKNKNIELTGLEQSFVSASLSRRRRAWWIKRAIAAALIILTIVASGAAYLAQQERDNAKTEAKTAEQVSEFLVGLFEVSDPSEALGDTITAREILDKGAEKIEVELADQPEVQATLMNTMGNVYRELGLYDQAVSLLEKSLNIRRQLFGNTHPSIATGLLYLAGVHFTTGNYTKAEDNVREALVIRQKIFGDRDSTVATCLNDLALILDFRGEDSTAEVMYREALSIRRELFGNKNKRITTSLNNLGYIAYEKGNYPEAEKLFREVIMIRRDVYGNEHPKLAIGLNNLAAVFNKMGEFSKAEELHKEALAIRQKIYGDEHPDVALSFNNLGKTYIKLGNLRKAEELCKQALLIRRKFYGNEHSEVANSLYNLGNLNMKLGNYTEAVDYYNAAIATQIKLGGDQNKSAVISLNSLAELHQVKDDLAKAEEIYQRALAISVNKLPSNYLTAITMGKMGSFLAKMNRFNEAEGYLLNAYENLNSIFGIENEYTIESLQDIIELYEAWNKPEKTAVYETILQDSTSMSNSK